MHVVKSCEVAHVAADVGAIRGWSSANLDVLTTLCADDEKPFKQEYSPDKASPTFRSVVYGVYLLSIIHEE